MAAKKAPAKKAPAKKAPTRKVAAKKSSGNTGSANAAEKNLMNKKKKKSLENRGINSRFYGEVKRDSSWGSSDKKNNARRVTSNIPSSPGRTAMTTWDSKNGGGYFVGKIRGLRTEPVRSEKAAYGDPRNVVAINMAKPGPRRLTENPVVKNSTKKKRK